MVSLEAPGSASNTNWDALYRYRGDEVSPSRPVFTGDVFQAADASTRLMVVQHPCAIRKDGVQLVDNLLVVPVLQAPQRFTPTDWQRFYKQMPLPDLLGPEGDHYAAHFHKPNVVSSEAIPSMVRITSLSLRGVNLLLQRWVHHNSRVVVETHALNAATIEQFEEADLVEEWCDECLMAGHEVAAAAKEAHEWLRSDAGDGIRWQEKLQDAQTRGEVRSAMRAHLKRLLA